MSRPNYSLEFIKCVQNEIKRISPSLVLSVTSADPLSQALEVLKLAVTAILDSKARLDQENNKFLEISSHRSGFESSRDYVLAKNKVIKAKNELKSYKLILNQRQSKLENQEKELKEYLDIFSDEKVIFENKKLILEGKNREIEIKTKALQDKELTFKHNYDTFLKEKALVEQEKQKINEKKEQINLNYQDSEKIKEINLSENKKLKETIEKYELEAKILQEKLQSVNLKYEYIEKVKEDLDRSKKLLEEERKQLYKDRESLQTFKQQLSDERLSLYQEKTENQTRRSVPSNKPDYHHKRGSSDSNLKDLNSLFKAVEAQVAVFNNEVAIKESKILAKEKKLAEDEEKLLTASLKISSIQKSLISTKSELLDFYDKIIPEIETLFNKASLTMKSLNEKYCLLDSLYSQVNQNFSLFSPRDLGNASKELKYNKFESKTPSQFGGSYDSKTIDDVARELESKLLAVEKKEEELRLESIQLAKNKENIRLIKTDLEKDKEKLKKQFYHLESGFKALASKEKELVEYKQELDKKSVLLSVREKQLILTA